MYSVANGLQRGKAPSTSKTVIIKSHCLFPCSILSYALLTSTCALPDVLVFILQVGSMASLYLPARDTEVGITYCCISHMHGKSSMC